MNIKTDPRCAQSSTHNFISVSGGKDSLAQWLVAIENGLSNITPVFADTGHEHQITYDYIDYLDKKLGRIQRVKADFSQRIQKKAEYIKEHWPNDLSKVTPGKWVAIRKTEQQPPENEPQDIFKIGTQKGDFVWISARPPLDDAEIETVINNAIFALKPTGNPFIDLCLWKGRFPSTRARFCSFELKHEPIRQQIIEPALLKYDDVISWQGVRAQESPEREDLAEWVEDADDTAGLHVYRPIHKWTHNDVFDIAKRHGIKPNPLYTMGCKRVGCMPCIHVNKSELKQIFLRFPQVAKYMDDMEMLVAHASKRGNATFFYSQTDPMRATRDSRAVTRDDYKFSSYRDYAMSTRGGRQFDLLAGLNDKTACSSVYAGVCE